MDSSDLKAEMVSGLSKQMIEYLLNDLRVLTEQKENLETEIEQLRVINRDLEDKLRAYRSQSITVYQEPLSAQ